jgi:PAS domain S-box-containing protein
MQIYLLAANLFALAALLLKFGGLSGEIRNGRLLPLFLLVISRSLALILSFLPANPDQAIALYGIGALEVFSTFCVIWVLTGSTRHLPEPLPLLVRLGAGVASFLSLASLFSFWPIPSQLHSLAIAIFGIPFILIGLGQLRWTYLAAPLLLTLANFLILIELPSVSWLLSLLAYAFFINAVHLERLRAYDQTFHALQETAEARIQAVVNLSHERQRWFEVSEIINTIPNLTQSMEHIAQSMAHVTHADQSAVIVLDSHVKGQARLLILYSPERPVHIDGSEGLVFELVDCPPLQKALNTQQQIWLPQPKPSLQNVNGLNKLYELWAEDRVGPTLIQPLIVQNQPIGALVLGNPVTQRSIRDSDARLCQALAAQIATLVEHRRRYLELASQAEVMATSVLEQVGEPVRHIEPERAGRTLTAAAPEPAEAILAAAEADRDPTPVTPAEPKQTDRLEVYRAIIETISNGVVVSNAAGQVQLVNPAAERILGKSSSELMGQSIGTIYGAIEAREPIDDLIVAFSRRNQPLPTFVETDERAIQGQLIPWRNDDYEWLGIIAIFRDVTREVTADRTRNEFLAALSRELRAPMTAIKGYTELIINGAITGYSDEQMHVQQIIHSSTERMVEVLDNAIQLRAEDRNRFVPRFEDTNVEEVINAALREMRPLAQLRELTLSREIKMELPRIAVDRHHLHRILDNLLSNACRFTAHGGHISVRAWVQSEREGNTTQPYLMLAVADNGVGIPDSEFKRIFDPFYQLNNENVDGFGGMGMGLAVVKELVELHRGRVWVESVVDDGSIFQVALPITQEFLG